MTETTALVQIIEASLLAAGKPMTVAQLAALFEEHERPANEDIRTALTEVGERCDGRGFELIEVASGFRLQVREQFSPWVGRLWQERPQKYSRALLETLALIAYRQPITRGEIEEIRGVAVSTQIIRTLHERDWIRAVGHRDVPGRPAMYATTRQFLDYFNLKSLDQLPALADIRDLETLNAELGFGEPLPESLRAEAEAAKGSATEDGEAVAEDAGSEPIEAGAAVDKADEVEEVEAAVETAAAETDITEIDSGETDVVEAEPAALDSDPNIEADSRDSGTTGDEQPVEQSAHVENR